MGEVIDILAKQPHLSGGFVCLECKASWTGVAPVGVLHVECPKCGILKGVVSSTVLPSAAAQCFCGCFHFYVSPDETLCCYCGTALVL